MDHNSLQCNNALSDIVAAKLLENASTNDLRLGQLTRILLETPELREAYSALHAGLRLNAAADASKSILVTSAQPQQGKTTVASCLAITASLAGQTTLLIDGDMRRPRLGATVGILNTIGLGEILEGQAEAADVVHDVDLFDGSKDTGRLCVMSAGRKSPSFLPAVNWTKARTTFRSIAEKFEIVLLDSPPILAANDALLFAGMVDAVLLVIGADNSDRDEVLRAKEQLKPTGTPIIGAVLNMFDPELHGRSTQPYRSYYLDPRTAIRDNDR